jgi:hypothetical protein
LFTLSFNISKSDKNEIQQDDCSIFVSSQKAQANLQENHNSHTEEMKLADLTGYENLKKNSFLESQMNYKLNDTGSMKNQTDNNNDFLQNS